MCDFCQLTLEVRLRMAHTCVCVVVETSAKLTETFRRHAGKYSRICYNERSYNERILQRTVFISKIKMLHRTQMLQRTGRNTIGRRNTRMRMTCRAFPLWLELQSSSLLSFVRFSYQFSSVISLVQLSAYLRFSSDFLKTSQLYNFSHEPAK